MTPVSVFTIFMVRSTLISMKQCCEYIPGLAFFCHAPGVVRVERAVKNDGCSYFVSFRTMSHGSSSSHSTASSGHGSCSLALLNAENLTCPITDVRNATDFSFVLISAFLIFFMKAGFVMLEYGTCNLGPVGRRLLLRMKVIDTVLGALAFWLIGYSIAFTPKHFDFSHAQFGDLESEEEHLEDAHSAALWEFHFAFAANAATVVTGAVVGRVQLIGYMLGTIAITGIVNAI